MRLRTDWLILVCGSTVFLAGCDRGQEPAATAEPPAEAATEAPTALPRTASTM